MCRHIVKGILLLMLSQAFALPSDKNEVIHVSADSASISQQEHKGIYRGTVVLVQGTTNLRADYAETKGNEANKLVYASAKGNEEAQAHYWTKTDPGKPELHAFADLIEYYPMAHIIKLTGHAMVRQGNNKFTAATLTYDTEKQHVVSESNETTRTTIVIYPEKKKDDSRSKTT